MAMRYLDYTMKRNRIRQLAICFMLACAALASVPSAVAQSAEAASEGDPAAMRHHGIAGTITAVQDGKLTLKTFDGKTATVQFDSNTKFVKDRQPAALKDFKVGTPVLVRGEAAGESNWNATLVATRSDARPGEMRDALGKRFIAGQIKSIKALQITIARPDGQTQTIAVDETTSFRKQDESITLADLKAGDYVFGRGEVKDGIFVPAILNLADPNMMAQFGQMMSSGAPSQPKK